MPLTFAQPTDDAIPIRPVEDGQVEATLAILTTAQATWARQHGFKGALGQTCVLPDTATGQIGLVLMGYGTPTARKARRFAVGAAIAGLPAGHYTWDAALTDAEGEEVALGYLFACYRFDRYRPQSSVRARLVAPRGLDIARLEALAAGEALTRDLINTPAADMGPAELATVAMELADEFGGTCALVEGVALLRENFPLIHAVGRAAARAPRLIDLSWGGAGPTLTLVGKGVCFDTGGLNLKSGASMGLMKKDMGGAATVLGLARIIMGLNLKLRLRVLIPAVENAVSGSAMRPGDILTARNGMTVEVNNTDAEGRLVLADALALANETPAALMICMATLTGAARVALGADIAPMFTDDDHLAQAVMTGGVQSADPVWRLPFHAPYETLIEPGIADLDNAPKGGLAGAITAALFLRRFVPDCPRFAHFDIYGWQQTAAPARPVGGVGQGARAILAALPKVFDL